MKKKLYSIGIIIVMAVLIFCTAYRKSLGEYRQEMKNQMAEERLEQSCGYYIITEFCHVPDYAQYASEVMTEKEAAMMLGKIVAIQPGLFVTYDSERSLGYEEYYFTDKSYLHRFAMEHPSYRWGSLEADETDVSLMPDEEMERTLGEEYFGQLDGIVYVPQICEPGGMQYFYTLTDKDKLIMYSTINRQYFVLERCSEEFTSLLLEWSDQGRCDLLQGMYGEYEVMEFLPEKYYDSTEDGTLSREEVNQLIGRTVSISEDLFVTYDNRRYSQENNLVKKEIETPDYRISSVQSEEIYGVWDGMFPDELSRQQYVEIDVYPLDYYISLWHEEEDELPRLYLTTGGGIFLYAMGEYFLLERALETETDILNVHYGSYRIMDFYPASEGERQYREWHKYEPDRLQGRVVHINSERLITYDTKGYKGIERNKVEYPEYSWKSMKPEKSDAILSEVPGLKERAVENDFGWLNGFIIASDTNAESNKDKYFYFYAFTDRDTLLMSVMEGVFLLERCKEGEIPPMLEWSRQEGSTGDLSDWVGKYTYSEGYTDYGIEIYKEEDGEYYADIEIKVEKVNSNVKLKAYVCEGAGRIFLVFKECLTEVQRWEWENRWSEVLLSFRKDSETGDIYTYWEELDRNKESGNVYFVKE